MELFRHLAFRGVNGIPQDAKMACRDGERSVGKAIPAFFVCPKWPVRVEQGSRARRRKMAQRRGQFWKVDRKNQVAGQREEIDAYVMRMSYSGEKPAVWL